MFIYNCLRRVSTCHRFEGSAERYTEYDKAPADRQRIWHSHSPYRMMKKGEGVKYIYVYRDGRDVCVSHYHHCRGISLAGCLPLISLSVLSSAFLLWGYEGDFNHFFNLFVTGEVESSWSVAQDQQGFPEVHGECVWCRWGDHVYPYWKAAQSDSQHFLLLK